MVRHPQKQVVRGDVIAVNFRRQLRMLRCFL
jgi:hypothetical protein